MRQNDARQLSHDILEDMRRRAVMAVQAGQSPEVVGKAFDLNRTTIYDWLAQYRRGGWGGLKTKPWGGAAQKPKGKEVGGVQNRGQKKTPSKKKFCFWVGAGGGGGEVKK